MKICLDAGHQGRYNQSPADHRYYESVMVWKLHLLQKKYLEEYGIEKEKFFDVIDKMAEDAMASGSPSNTRKDLTVEDLKKIYKALW